MTTVTALRASTAFKRIPTNLIASIGLPLALVAMIAIFAFSSSTFFTVDNLLVVLRQAAVLGIAGIGATMILISDRLDISQGAVIAGAGLVCVSLAQDGLPIGLAMLAALAFGGLVGLANGVLTEVVRIPGFITTLAMAMVVRGGAQLFTDGQSLAAPLTKGFDLLSWFGVGTIGGIPVPVVLMLVLYAIARFVLRRTTWGLRTFAVGSSARAARVAGLRVGRHAIQVFAIAGVLSAVADVLLAGRLGSASPNNGAGAEFDIFAAVVLGGTSLQGGRGSVVRTLFGVVFLATLSNGLVILNVSCYIQGIATGAVLLLSLAIDRWRAADDD